MVDDVQSCYVCGPFTLFYWNGTKLPQSFSSSSSASYDDGPADTILLACSVNCNDNFKASCTVVVVAPRRLLSVLLPGILLAAILVRDDDRRGKENGRGLRLLPNGG